MKSITLTYNTSRILFWTLISGIVFLAGLYMFFVNETVRNVVARQGFEKQITEFGSTIASLESDYVSKTQHIDMVFATSRGFSEVLNPTFVSKKQSVSFSR
ncbi:MAG: hypothetical protein RJA61_615 [Candidatus Parcubacteria bacterium]|jgi:tRNA threonylcarbamoyladenosine modification (KEOPS) complex Cgi121 subunit